MGNGLLTRPDGWFSRRHPTRAERDAAVAKWRAKHGKEARKTRAAERARADAVSAEAAHQDGEA